MAIQSNFPSLKPTLLLDFANTKQLDPRITFTRGSTATYYDGKTTAMAEQNLVSYSQEFDNAAWAKTAATVTANTTTAPDGTTTADSLVETAANNFHIASRGAGSITSSGLTTFSCFAKANTRTFIVLQINEGANRFATLFNLSTGAVVTTNTTGSPTSTSNSITSVGSGWYRCIVTCNVTSTCDPIVALSDSATPTWSASVPVYTGDGTSGLYIWGAQLEQRSAVSAYTATTTQAITNYIPVLQTAASGVARFDNNPTTGESLGLLIEESRTNINIYSEQLNNAAYTLYGSLSVSPNVVIAPDGTLTSDIVIPSAATGTFEIGQGLAKAASSITYTLSGFSKVAGYDFLIFRIDNGAGNGVKGAFNISTATVSTAFATNGSGFTFVGTSLTSVGNGWVRWSVSFTTDTSITLRPIIYVSNATGDGFSVPSYTANGFSGMFMWGMQLEAGAFATSYIPTVASTVTRASDLASMTGTNFSSWYRADEGTIFIDANGFQPALTFTNANSGYNNIRQIYRVSSQTNSPLYVYEANNGVASVNTQSMGNTNALTFKCAYGFKTNDFAGSVNAGTVATDTSGIPALPVDRLGIGLDFGVSATSCLTGIFRKIAFYPQRLSNTNLQALTS